ncbi:MAG TPA: PQQ-binding-like beta-propeller repeat protein [Polyangiaceae bacterium]|nr:PQQ-binding-like beta-propeller repeat protein [Polyangiaceae bacterium]
MVSPSASCPRCGAAVPFGQHGTLTCTYCGTSFSPPARGAAAASSGLPVGCIVGGLALLLVVVAGAGVAFFTLGGSKGKSASTVATTATAVPEKPEEPLTAAATKAKERPPRPEGNLAPLLADLNGDGTADAVVAATVYEDKAVTRRYVAIDGRSGAVLWRSGDIGSDLFNSGAVLEHGRLMVVNRTGKITAFDGRSGLEQWEQELGERVVAICKAKEPDAVRFKTADDRLVSLDTRSGNKTPVAGKPPCERANANQEDRFSRDIRDRSDSRAPAGVKSVVCGGVRVMGDQNFTLPEQCKAQFRVDPDGFAGMSARSLWQHEGGLLVFGSKSPGTRVPMVGFAKGGKLVWSSEVPDKNPLEAREGAPDKVALDAGRLFVGYEPQSGDKPASVTAFDVGTGARLWHVALPGKLRSVRSLAAAGGAVFIGAGDNLVALGAADGKQRFLLGDGD